MTWVASNNTAMETIANNYEVVEFHPRTSDGHTYVEVDVRRYASGGTHAVYGPAYYFMLTDDTRDWGIGFGNSVMQWNNPRGAITQYILYLRPDTDFSNVFPNFYDGIIFPERSLSEPKEDYDEYDCHLADIEYVDQK